MLLFDLIRAVTREIRPASDDDVAGSAQRQVGDCAEAFALRELKKQGFRLIRRGASDPDGELDLIGRFDDYDGVVVIEVRARKEGGMQSPLEAIGYSKQKQVVRTARRLLPQMGIHDPLRFDAVGVWLDGRGNPQRMEHVPNAFRAKDFIKPRRRHY